jgi:hypothetical protein
MSKVINPPEQHPILVIGSIDDIKILSITHQYLREPVTVRERKLIVVRELL